MKTLQIVAPVSSLVQARAVLEAGADELYCGLMTDGWVAEYGDGDVLSRRQGRASHVANERELQQVVKVACELNRPVALVLNGRYTSRQGAALSDLAMRWEEMGGTAIIVSEIGMLRMLAERKSRLSPHLSLLAGVFNSSAAEFFDILGVSRIILPRDLTLQEVGELTAGYPDMEYEAIALNQKCRFIDGMCGFYHDLRIPSGTPSAFNYERTSGERWPVAYSNDPEYEGHGCDLSFVSQGKRVANFVRDDWTHPHCAACQLPSLNAANVRWLKIAGRGYPTDVIVKSVRFLRDAVGLWQRESWCGNSAAAVRQLYRDTFFTDCGQRQCYYNPH